MVEGYSHFKSVVSRLYVKLCRVYLSIGWLVFRLGRCVVIGKSFGCLCEGNAVYGWPSMDIVLHLLDDGLEEEYFSMKSFEGYCTRRQKNQAEYTA